MVVIECQPSARPFRAQLCDSRGHLSFGSLGTKPNGSWTCFSIGQGGAAGSNPTSTPSCCRGHPEPWPRWWRDPRGLSGKTKKSRRLTDLKPEKTLEFLCHFLKPTFVVGVLSLIVKNNTCLLKKMQKIQNTWRKQSPVLQPPRYNHWSHTVMYPNFCCVCFLRVYVCV